jgi:hypothetical protein
VFPVGIGLRDPRSQKRDLGHPSISPSDIAEGTSFVISLPTRFSESAARDDKGKATVPERVVAEPRHLSKPIWTGLTEPAELSPGRSPGLACAHEKSRRDD